ncbi:hypothetical protein HQ601_00013 [Streptomyces phage Alderaan]|nr:hypothetical protein HQ601_00013 [Streptomyces phage Alderaan]
MEEPRPRPPWWVRHKDVVLSWVLIAVLGLLAFACMGNDGQSGRNYPGTCYGRSGAYDC